LADGTGRRPQEDLRAAVVAARPGVALVGDRPVGPDGWGVAHRPDLGERRAATSGERDHARRDQRDRDPGHPIRRHGCEA
jgi:hypothetical protein